MTTKKTQPPPAQKPCAHPSFSREFYLGSHTGDYICDECGDMFMLSEKEAIIASRSKKE